MPVRTEAPPGHPCWIDLLTSDADASIAFYSELFGWTAHVGGPEVGGYTIFNLGDYPVAGCMGSEGGDHPSNIWSTYLAVTDIAATTAAAAAAGAHVILPPMPVTDIGHMAMVADPGGAAIGMWQAETFHGFGILAEFQAPAWFELHTRAYDASVAFYREVFGWDTHVMGDSPEFRYTTLLGGEEAAAGIMDDTGHAPDDSPPHWAVYFSVRDADAAIARVVELGGGVVMEPQDTPYGRLAVCTDSTGSIFSLNQPNA